MVIAPSLTEGRMIEFIQDGSRAVDKTTWFDFPEITFETASAELTGAAKAQVGRIHEVLKAYPRLRSRSAATPTTPAIRTAI